MGDRDVGRDVFEFGILGPLTASRGGDQLSLGSPQQRATLAVLVCHVGRIVPRERLVDSLWGDAPSPAVVTSVRAHVSHLRQVLEPSRGEGEAYSVLVTESSGYRLAVPETAVDAQRFARLVAAAQSSLEAGEPGAALGSSARRCPCGAGTSSSTSGDIRWSTSWRPGSGSYGSRRRRAASRRTSTSGTTRKPSPRRTGCSRSIRCAKVSPPSACWRSTVSADSRMRSRPTVTCASGSTRSRDRAEPFPAAAGAADPLAGPEPAERAAGTRAAGSGITTCARQANLSPHGRRMRPPYTPSVDDDGCRLDGWSWRLWLVAS